MTTILTSLTSISPWHIPPLFIATAFTLGGLLPLYAPRRAMLEYGLPERIAAAPAAHTPFAIYGSRTTILGVALWIFYLRGQLREVDTLLGLLVGAGAVDGYLCWKEGVPGQGVFRFVSGLLVGGWGLFGLSSRG